MGNNRQFNFDLYVEELLAEALSPAQMQDRIKEVGLDPTKYDQNHLLFLVGLINSNQGIEVYDELLSKIKDKGLLNSLLSVSVNDRRSDNPMVDMDKVSRALENAGNPAELRNILSGQKRQEQTKQSTYDKGLLQWYLAKRGGMELFEILAKLEVERDGELDQFIAEFSRKSEEVKEYLIINAQRAKNLKDLTAILHEGETKNINPFNSTTSLTLKDLQNDALYYNDETHIYIIRTTFQDNIVKSIRANLKYGQGNRFGLCISSKSENYYAGYRTGSMTGYALTTYFVYSLHDKSADPSDINNYEIAIIDSESTSGRYSYNTVATVATRSVSRIHGKDGVTWNFGNRDIGNQGPYAVLNALSHIFDGKEKLIGKDGVSYDLDEYNFREIFEPVLLGRKEHRIRELIDDFETDNFLNFSDSEKIALITDEGIRSAVLYKRELFEQLSPEVRMSIVKLIGRYTMNGTDIMGSGSYSMFTDAEKNVYNKTAIKEIREELDKQLTRLLLDGEDLDLTDHKTLNIIFNKLGGPSLSLIDYEIIANDEKLKTIYIDGLQANNNKIRDYVLSKVDENGVYKGDLDLQPGSRLFQSSSSFFPPKYFLPDLSDIIIDGNFNVYYRNLLSLKGCPKIVESFECSGNSLTNLEGGPIAAIKYNVGNSDLNSLLGAPKYVYIFYIDHNRLTSLEGCPEYVGGDFQINGNRFKSLKGLPKIIGGMFNMYNVPTKLMLDFDPSSIIVGDDYLVDGKTYNHLMKGKKDQVNELRDNFLYDKIKELKNKHMMEYKAKKAAGVNKESLVYSLLKSYLLRS